MESDIQFSTVSQRAPQSGVRPDQDGQFIVGQLGEARTDRMPIFVDLDVMRDMVAHAYSDQKVELGGVMLGRAMADADGQPFVVVSDCLRADHYKATRGSFKFTHQTWGAIGRQLESRHPDLRIVGWYHTHPGWTVFLSPMDLFICENFFASPEDVALVIDPCNDTAGWFQWQQSQGQRRATMGPSDGYRLFTHHLRRDELNYFCRHYDQEPVMNNDPRYVESTHVGPAAPTILVGGQRGWFDAAIAFLLVIPTLLLSVLVWHFIDGEITSSNSAMTVSDQSLTAENRVLREMLQTMVVADGGNESLVKSYADLAFENQMLEVNLKGQLARIDSMVDAQVKAESTVSQLELAIQADSQTIAGLSDQVQRLHAAKAQHSHSGESGATQGVATDASVGYFWTLLIAAVACGGGVLFGTFISKPINRSQSGLESQPDLTLETKVGADAEGSSESLEALV